MPPRLDQLTPHFYAEQFAQPEAHGYAAASIPPRYLPRVYALCQVLECIQVEVSAPLRILSGYRSREFNRVIRGAYHSPHVEGYAADIATNTRPPSDLYALILALVKHESLSIGGLGLYPHYVHVDIRPGEFTTWRRSQPPP